MANHGSKDIHIHFQTSHFGLNMALRITNEIVILFNGAKKDAGNENQANNN